MDPSGGEQDLLLKESHNGLIEVLYDATHNDIGVWTYSDAQGWVRHGDYIPVTFNDGDQFGARAKANGDVEVYKNGVLLGTRNISSWEYYAGGGRIGIWFVDVTGALLDDFGGGTLSGGEGLMAQGSSFGEDDSSGLLEKLQANPKPTRVPSATNTPTLTPTPPQNGFDLNPIVNFAPVSFKLPAPVQQTSSLIIDYTYDPLNRLTGATYSDGRNFAYTYDAAGNVLELQQNLGPGTIITTYIYDEANQLNTAQQGSTTWQYTYDANGSLISDSVKNYTYNSANRLVEISEQSTVTSLSYNGLGQRLSMDADGVIAYYVMDGDRSLTAQSGGNTTFYLYGLGAIGEKTIAWNYSLPDGTNTPRQLSDLSGGITLSARYTPWGDTLDSFGTGNFTFGYLGGVLDATTGLLYVGNGQYYDPATGRFLTRNVYPNSPNPYVPWNPLGVILGPLALVSLFYTRKRKGSKTGTFLVLLIVLGGVGMTLAACAPAPTPPSGSANTTLPAMPAQTQTPVPTGPGTVSDFPTGTPTAPIETPTPIPCPTPTWTPTPLSMDFELAQYGVSFTGNIGQWTIERKEAVRNAVKTIASRFTDVVSGDPIQNFIKVYGYINFEFCNEGCVPFGYGWAAGDHWIKFDGMYSDMTIATRLIVHEMGHLFDRAVCASLNQGKCYDERRNDLIWGNNTARADLTGKTGVCLNSICLGRKGHIEPDGIGYWGFAGNWQVWQFGENDEIDDGTNGELWADMFLGWTYNQWGDDTRGMNRMSYMNDRMAYHLRTNFNFR